MNPIDLSTRQGTRLDCPPMIADPLTQPAPGWLSPGARVYAVGDVHGCDQRLAALHRQVADDLARRPTARPLLVHLGDYVDRGPDSANVVRRLAEAPVLAGCPLVCLRGNHEQMLIDALTGDAGNMRDWLGNGAEATLRSWQTSARRTQAEWRAAVGPDLAFLEQLPFTHQVDGYVFVHAGLRPMVRMDQQSEHDMLWVRDAFLRWTGPVLPEAPDMAVVHGHTPVKRPEVVGMRIGIDTGAVAGGALTCAVLEGRTVRFLTA